MGVLDGGRCAWGDSAHGGMMHIEDSVHGGCCTGILGMGSCIWEDGAYGGGEQWGEWRTAVCFR